LKLTGEIQNHYLDGEETPAKAAVESLAESDGGIDWLHLHFRDPIHGHQHGLPYADAGLIPFSRTSTRHRRSDLHADQRL
jgi:hypothetical protein